MHDLQHGPHGPYSSTPTARIHRASDNPALDFTFRVWNGADENLIMHQSHANCEGGLSSEGIDKQQSSPLMLHSHLYSHLLSSPDAILQGTSARGRRELTEMVRNEPGSNFGMSMKDVNINQRKQNPQEACEGEDTISEAISVSADSKATLHINKQKKTKILRSQSLDSRQFLLKMFFPTFSARSPKSSVGRNRSVMSPRPSSDVRTEKPRESTGDSVACSHPVIPPRLSFDGTEKLMDEWKRNCAVGSDMKNSGGRNSGYGSTASSSSNRNRSADNRDSPSCWPLIFHGRRSKFK